MANQQNSYTVSQGTGTNNRDFSYTFPSFTEGEVKVEIDNVVKTLTTHYTIVNHNTTTGGTVRFNATGLPNGTAGTTPVRIFRQTDVETPKALFTSGASLKAEELNANFKQVRHALQETIGAVATDRKVQRFNIEADSIDGTLIADDVINSEHYVAGSIDHEHLANDIIDGDNIQDDVINSEHYAAGSIDEEHIANSAVTQNKLANNSVGTPELINGSVTTDKLANDNVTLAKLGGGALPTDITVASANIVNGTIATADIGGDQITNALIADNQIDSEHYVDGSIDHVHLANDIIDGDNIQDDVVNSEHIAAGALDNEHYAAGSITSDKLNGATVITASEQGTATTNDTSFLTSAAADARFFNISSGDTIKDGQTFPDDDTTIATTAAINDRIIDLVDDVGGFVPIANETSFPTSNPDVNNGAGTIVSVSAASTNLVPSGTTVTIANGRGSGLAVIITGVSATIPQGFGFLVETTSTDHTYAFHRLSPKATEVTTVASKATEVTTVHTNITNINAVANNATNINAVAADATDIGAVAAKATEIGRLGTAAAVADMAILGTADVVADMAILGTNDVVADLNTLGTADVVADLNTLGTADVVSDMNALATTNNITSMSTCKDNISSINNCSTNISSVNTFGDQYQVAANNPSTDGGGNALAAGDLYFNTSANELKVYNGSSWQGGVTAAGSFAATTGNTFTGDNRYNDNVKALFGTGSDFEIFHNGSHSHIDNNVGNLMISSASHVDLLNADQSEYLARFAVNGAASLYYDNSKKLETTATGVLITGSDGGDGGAKGDFKFLQTDGTLKAMFDASASAFEFYDNTKAIFGSGDDLEIYHDGSNSYIKENGTGLLKILTNGLEVKNVADNALAAFFGTSGASELYFNGSKKLETTSGGVNVTGALTVNGSAINTDLVSDTTPQLGGDLQSNGNDIDFADNDKAIFGTGGDLQIFHNGTDSFIQNFTGDLNIRGVDGKWIIIQAKPNEHSIICKEDGAVELYYDNSKKLETTSYGNASAGQVRVTSSNASTVAFSVGDVGTGFYNAGSNAIGYSANGTQKWNIDSGGNLRLVDNVKANFGTSDDLQIYHDGSNSWIDNGTGLLRLSTDGAEIELTGTNGNEYLGRFINNGAVELYHNGNKTFETTADGADCFNRLRVLGGTAPQIQFNSDSTGNTTSTRAMLGLATGSNNFINGAVTGDIVLNTPHRFIVGHDTGELMAIFDPDGAAGLFYDNSLKFETNSGGCTLTGTLTTTSGINAGNNVSLADGIKLKLGTSDDLLIHHTSNDNIINAQNGNLYIQRGGTTSLTFDGNGDLNLPDNRVLGFGNSADLQIYHNGSDSYIRTTTGSTYILPKSGENGIQLVPDGSVNLYYDNSKIFETTSTGIKLNNVSTIANAYADNLQLGDGVDHAGITIYTGATKEGAIYFGDGSSSDAHRGYFTYEHSNDRFIWGTAGSNRLVLDNTGILHPNTNNAQDLGTSSQRWRNIYTNDLNLSNEGSSNDVDGTWGDWTIQEGESDLFLKNNRSGKKYKFNLTEIS